MGKHFKNNPIITEKGRILIATIVVILAIIAGAIGISAALDKNDDKDEKKGNNKDDHQVEYTIPDNVNINAILDDIESNNRIYAEDGRLNTTGLVLQYLREKISDPNLSNQEKYIIIRDILSNDEALFVELYNYVREYYSYAKEVDATDIRINTSNITTITSDQELMGYVSTYAQMYGVPEECVVGILASSLGEGNRLENNINMNGYWNDFSATRSARNTGTLNDDRLNDYQHPQTKEEYVRYICMVLANSLKESNRDLGIALEFYYLGVDNMKSLGPNAQEREQAKKFSNEVLLYVMAYEKDDIVTVEFYYPSMQGMQKYSISYISSDFENHLINTAMAISSQINVNVSSFDKGMSR